jgi:hypothetical protein
MSTDVISPIFHELLQQSVEAIRDERYLDAAICNSKAKELMEDFYNPSSSSDKKQQNETMSRLEEEFSSASSAAEEAILAVKKSTEILRLLINSNAAQPDKVAQAEKDLKAAKQKVRCASDAKSAAKKALETAK